jgi:hypothetical protein
MIITKGEKEKNIGNSMPLSGQLNKDVFHINTLCRSNQKNR